MRPVSESVPVVGHMPVRPAQSDRLRQGPAAAQLQRQQQQRRRRRKRTARARQRPAARRQDEIAPSPPVPVAGGRRRSVERRRRRGASAPPEAAAAVQHPEADVVRPEQRRRRREFRRREVVRRGPGETAGIRVVRRGLGFQKVQQPFRVVLRGRRIEYHQLRYIIFVFCFFFFHTIFPLAYVKEGYKKGSYPIYTCGRGGTRGLKFNGARKKYRIY